MVITAGWAFAVMAGVFTAIASGSSDAHLNPAVTLGFAVRAGNFDKLAPYVAAQPSIAAPGARKERDLCSIADFSPVELESVLELATLMKARPGDFRSG